LAATHPDQARRLAHHAEQTARKIGNPRTQSEALLTIATALAATNPSHARLVLSSVMSPEHVFEMLPAIGRLEASATAEICEHALLCFGIHLSDVLVD
jgi:hypothetical protein